MSLFGSINIAGSGIAVDQTWLDSISSNIANMNDAVNPANQTYQDQQLVVAPTGTPPQDVLGLSNQTNNPIGTGVAITNVVTDLPNGQLAYQPNNPVANNQGMVRIPGVNLANQLGQLDIAERSYQANAAVINHAKAAYQSVLALGA